MPERGRSLGILTGALEPFVCVTLEPFADEELVKLKSDAFEALPNCEGMPAALLLVNSHQSTHSGQPRGSRQCATQWMSKGFLEYFIGHTVGNTIGTCEGSCR